jgi:Tfp pilus assembly protein PilX
LTVVLVTVATLLLVGGGVLGALLLDERSSATEVAAAEAAEDNRQAAALRDAERQVTDAEQRLTAAESAAAEAEVAAEAAEVAQGEAEQAAAPDQESIEEFLWLLRDSDTVFWSATDDELVEIGTLSCQYFDEYGNNDEAIAELGAIAIAHGLTSHQAAQLTSAAIVVFCPQHSLD